MAVAQETLLARLAQRDETALTELMAHYAAPLHRYALGLTGDWWLTEEIVQDTFYKAWDLAINIHPGCLQAWLYRVTRNTCIDRKWKLRGLLTVGLHEVTGAAAIGPGTEIERERHADVREAVSELPPHHRQMIHMRFFDEWKYEEIALILGIPCGTVKSRLNQAKRHLRKELQHLTA